MSKVGLPRYNTAFQNSLRISFQGGKAEAIKKFVFTVPPMRDVKKAAKMGLSESGFLALSLAVTGGNPIGALIMKFFMVDSARAALKCFKLKPNLLKINPDYNFNSPEFTRLLVKENPFNTFSQFLHGIFKGGFKAADKLDAYASKNGLNT